MQLAVELRPHTDWKAVAPTWASLAAAMANPSPFTAEPWVDTWLATFGESIQPSLLVMSSETRPVGVCIVSSTRAHAYGVPLQTVTLNATGEQHRATVYSEYNSLVCSARFEPHVAQAIADHLTTLNWDRVLLRYFSPGTARDALKSSLRSFACIEQQHQNYYVDLRAVRETGSAYVDFLSTTARKHLKQSLRHYSKRGPLQLRAADSVDDAVAMFEQLAVFARKRWGGRRDGCVFDAQPFLEFHRSLIRNWFSRGAVQLLTVTVGDRPVGVIYNLVMGERVYFYQCGYDYTDDKRLSPGALCISQTVQFLLDSGFDDYDFLSGHADYKKRFSTGSREVISTTFRASRVRFRFLDQLERLSARLQGSRNS